MKFIVGSIFKWAEYIRFCFMAIYVPGPEMYS